jgi:hypothetical protein
MDLGQYSEESRLIREIFESETFQDWVAGSHELHLYLDGLDECRIYIRPLPKLLSAQLRKYASHISRLRLRVACRTAEWSSTLSDTFKELWGGESTGEYELVSLRQRDVAEAAKSEGVDPPEFLREVERVRAQPLASRPITLRFLMESFRRDHRLYDTQAGLYEEACKKVCTEPNRDLIDVGPGSQLTASARLGISSRIAALLIFSGKSTIGLPGTTGDSDEDALTITDLAGGTERVDGNEMKIDDACIQDTLSTGLFSGRGRNKLGFAHQTFAEFLAARYLTSRHLNSSQIIRLVHHTETPKIVPQLAETAAWIAGMNDRIFEAIIETDPEVLLRSDVAKADNQSREKVVESLLQHFDDEVLIDTRLRNLYSKLDHPRITTQLSPYIRDRSKGWLVRRVAIDIAEACDVRELQNLLADIALDATEAHNVRDQAVHAVARIGDENIRSRLKPLLTDEAGDDPNDQLKGSACRALWPGLVSAEELFANVTEPKNSALIGAYSMFLAHELVPSLSAEDLPIALNWAGQYQSEHPGVFDDFGRLAHDILRMAWDHLDRPGVIEPFARIALERFQSYTPLFGRMRRSENEDPIGDDDERRRQLVNEIIAIVEDIEEQVRTLVLGDDRLIRGNDLNWLLDRLRAENSGYRQRCWSGLIKVFCQMYPPRCWDAIIEATRHNDILEEEFVPLIAPVQLGTPEAEHLRENYRMAQLLMTERERPLLDPPPRERIDACLARFESGEMDAWWQLNRQMTLEPNSTHYLHELEPDLQSLPGWKAADGATKARIVAAARVYVSERDAETERWQGTNTIYPPAFSGYRALYLLLKEDGTFLSQLPRHVWCGWASIILAYPEGVGIAGADNSYLDLIEMAYRHAPDQIISTLSALIDKENREHQQLFILRKIERCYNGRMCAALLQEALESSLVSTCVGDIIRELVRHAFQPAIEYASTCIEQRSTSNADEPARASECAIALLVFGAADGWNRVWSIIAADSEFGRSVVLGIIDGRREVERVDWLSNLSERDLGDLFIWLSREFPHENDPKEVGAHRVGSREKIGHFRDQVLDVLKARGTWNAREVIDNIREEFPDMDWLKWSVQTVTQNALEGTWKPISPKQFLELTQHRNSRLVRSGGELLDVLEESLQRLQERLTGENPEAKFLWNALPDTVIQPRDEGDFCDFVVSHLRQDLKGCGIVSLREVEVRRGLRSGDVRVRGQRTDIYVAAHLEERGLGPPSEILAFIEAKGCWNRELKSGLRDQLVDRYLRMNDCGFGLYLVGWFNCPAWDNEDPRKSQAPCWSAEEAQKFFSDQARDVSNASLDVRAVVVNAAPT